MVRLAPLCSLLLLLAGPVPAQVYPGQVPAPLPVDWGSQPALELTGDDAAAAVLVFHRSAATAAIDADALAQLQTDGGGFRAVVILPQAPAEPRQLEALQSTGLTVATDTDGGARTRWLGSQLDFYVVIVASGRVAWVGRPEQGMIAAARAAVAGTLDAAATADVWRRRLQLADAFDDGKGGLMREWAQQLVRDCPTDGPSWGLCYLAEAQKLGDPAMAGTTAEAAIAALQAEPRALAAFADLALRGDCGNRALARTLVAPLAAAAAAYPADLRVQLTRLRALVGAGEGRQVGMLAHQLARKVEHVANAALEFVEILTHDDPPQVHKELGARALDFAGKCDADPRLLAAARYALLLRCNDDPMAAKDQADDYMAAAPARVTLNNDAWHFMTELPTRGRFDAFALALVDRMLQQRAAMEFFEFDTAAMAMYRNGRLDEAVELQEQAIDKGGRDPIYQERLERYRAAAQKPTPAPR